MPVADLITRFLGRIEYSSAWRAMQTFTDHRDARTADELWFLEHPPVFTQGRNGKAEHLLDPGNIPVIQVDRGGQATYHGPGQLVAYVLLDLKRRNLGVRALVTGIEESIVGLLREWGVEAYPRADAPGVYVGGAKIAALGLRIRQGRSFHGLALNLDMDLEPFSRINPCGYKDMAVTRLADLVDLEGRAENLRQLADRLRGHLCRRLGYTDAALNDRLPESFTP